MVSAVVVIIAIVIFIVVIVPIFSLIPRLSTMFGNCLKCMKM